MANPFDQIDVTLIIPVYNLEKELDRCLQSIVGQVSPLSLECLIIDDGSTDGSLALARDYERRFPFIQVVSQANAGSGVARNIGLQMAQGRYVWCVDSDDRVAENAFLKLSPLLRAANAPEVFVFPFMVESAGGDAQEASEHSRRCRDILLPLSRRGMFTLVAAPELLEVPLYPWNKIVKNDLIRRSHVRFTPFRVNVDITYSLGAFLNAESIMFRDENIYVYAYHRPGGITQSVWDVRRLDVFKVLEECEVMLRRNPIGQPILFAVYTQFMRILTWVFQRIQPELRSRFVEHFQIFTSMFSDGEFARLWREGGFGQHYHPLYGCFFDMLVKRRQVDCSPNPLLSVIIPVGGKFDDLESTLRSLAAQYDLPAKYYEVLLTGEISEEVRTFCADVQGLGIFRIIAGAGNGENIRQGYQEAQGQYIHIMPPGTLVVPGALKRMLTELLAGNADMALADYQIFDKTNGHIMATASDDVWHRFFFLKFRGKSLEEKRILVSAIRPVPWQAMYNKAFLQQALDVSRIDSIFKNSYAWHWKTVRQARAFTFIRDRLFTLMSDSLEASLESEAEQLLKNFKTLKGLAQNQGRGRTIGITRQFLRLVSYLEAIPNKKLMKSAGKLRKLCPRLRIRDVKQYGQLFYGKGVYAAVMHDFLDSHRLGIIYRRHSPKP